MFLRIIYIAIGIVIAIMGYKAFDLYSGRVSAAKVDAEQIIGPDDANLNVVVFFDYQCPYCKDIYPTLIEAIQKDRKARLVLRLLPAMGEESDRLARLAYAATLQDKFMEVHTTLIHQQEPLGTTALQRLAREHDLDLEKLLADSETKAIRDKTAKNVQLARRIGVYATPTLLVGKILFTPTEGLPDVEDLLGLFAEARGEGPEPGV